MVIIKLIVIALGLAGANLVLGGWPWVSLLPIIWVVYAIGRRLSGDVGAD